MSDNWRKGFHQAVIDTVIRLGSPRKSGKNWELLYGWADYDAYIERKAQIESVGIDYDKTTIEEADWDEFKGTFYEGDTRVYGIDVHVVLHDGTEFDWRYGRTIGRFLMELLKNQ